MMELAKIGGLAVLVSTLAAYSTAQQTQPIPNPSQSEKAPAAQHETIDQRAETALRQPDDALYAAIGRLDPKKAQELNSNRETDQSIALLQQDLELIRSYNMLELLSEKRARISWAANELGGAYLIQKKPDMALDWFLYSKNIGGGQAHEGDNPNSVNLNIAVAAFNGEKYELAIRYAKEFLNGDEINTKKVEHAKNIIIYAQKRSNGN